MALHIIGWLIVLCALAFLRLRVPRLWDFVTPSARLPVVRTALGAGIACAIGLTIVTSAAGGGGAALAMIALAVALGLARVALNLPLKRPGLILFGSTRAALHWDLESRMRTAHTAARKLISTLAPEGWTMAHLSGNFLERLTGTRVLVLVYGLGLAVSPLVVAALAVIQFARIEPVNAIMLRTVGYEFLLLSAACITLSAICTSIVVVILRFIGVFDWAPKYRRALGMLGSCSGGGTIVGALVGTLVPLVAMIFASTTGTPGSTAFDAASPGLLLELSGLGAVVGFLVGQLAFIASLAGSWSNLVFRRTVVPAMFCGCVWLFAQIGINPQDLFVRIGDVLRTTVGVIGPSTDLSTVTTVFTADWRAVFVFVATYDHALMPGRALFPSLIALVLGVGCFVAFVVDIAKRTRAFDSPAHASRAMRT